MKTLQLPDVDADKLRQALKSASAAAPAVKATPNIFAQDPSPAYQSPAPPPSGYPNAYDPYAQAPAGAPAPAPSGNPNAYDPYAGLPDYPDAPVAPQTVPGAPGGGLDELLRQAVRCSLPCVTFLKS